MSLKPFSQEHASSGIEDPDSLTPELWALLRNKLDLREVAASIPDMNTEEVNEAAHRILPECLRGQRKMIRLGWKLFLEQDTTGSARRVMDDLGTLSEEAFMEVEEPLNLCLDEDWEPLLLLAAAALKAGQEDQAAAMYMVLQCLRPQSPQPYIANFSLVEAQAGPDIAADCYRLVKDLIVSPTFSYCAAACFQRANALSDARESIQAAVDLLNDKEIGFSISSSLRDRILALQQALQSQGAPWWEEA